MGYMKLVQFSFYVVAVATSGCREQQQHQQELT